jgi:hypothetical protein
MVEKSNIMDDELFYGKNFPTSKNNNKSSMGTVGYDKNDNRHIKKLFFDNNSLVNDSK